MAGLNLQAILGRFKWYLQVAIVVAICGGGLGAFWYWYLGPIGDEIVAKEKQIDELQKEVAKSLEQKKKFEQFKAEAQALGKRIEALKLILPLEKETDQILRTMRAEAGQSGVQILNVHPRPTIDHEVYAEWPWDMDVVGTYNSISAFFDKVRQLPRIVNISGLKINSRASEGARAFTASVGASYTATTFIYHDEPIATTAPTPKAAGPGK